MVWKVLIVDGGLDIFGYEVQCHSNNVVIYTYFSTSIQVTLAVLFTALVC